MTEKIDLKTLNARAARKEADLVKNSFLMNTPQGNICQKYSNKTGQQCIYKLGGVFHLNTCRKHLE